LEASIGLRGALADKRGTVAGRRALALVADRSGDVPGIPVTAGEELPEVRQEESAPPPYVPLGEPLITHQLPAAATDRRGGFRQLARRNLVAVGSGALLAAVLGTVVTLGMTSNDNADKNPAGKVDVNPSATQDPSDGTLGADPNQTPPAGAASARPATRPTNPGPDGTYGTTDDPTPSQPVTSPSADPSHTKGTGGGGTTPTPSKSRTTKPGTPTPSTSSPSSTGTSTAPPTDSSSPTSPTATPPSTTNTASGPASSSPASASQSTGTGTPTGSGTVM
jgi:hypothetical protein